MDLVEEEEAATAAAMAVMEVAATAAAMAVMEAAATAVAMAVMEVAATAAAMAVMEAAATAAAMAVMEAAATAAAIIDLIALTLINHLEQKVGKTEVMEILLKTLYMKVGGAEEKEEFPTRAMLQTKQVRNPFFQGMLLI